MIVKYIYQTAAYGPATIERDRQGRWVVTLGGEALGSYHRPEAALDDLCGGHTFSHSRCPDTSAIGLPDSLHDWTPVSR